MAWTDGGTGAYYPGGGPGSPGRPGSYCPQGWEEDFDRSQMSTQVLIARAAPTDVPVLRYTWSPAPGSLPPPAGTINLNSNPNEATHLYVRKVDAAGTDATLWLRYLHGKGDCSVNVKDAENKSRTYRVTAEPVEYDAYFDVPVFWTEGTEILPPGAVDLTLSITAETPRLYQDAYGVGHYGRMTFQRTDLLNTETDLFVTLADRILEVRGSNSVPRLEAVTLDARTGDHGIHNMNLMSSAAPEKPSRYLCRLRVDDRVIFERMCFASAVRHFVARDEWTLRITLDIAEWAGTL